MSRSLNGIGSRFARRGAQYIEDFELEDVASLAGYNFAALGTYWRSNTLAGFSQMKRGEMQEAMETFNLAVSTLAVWDLGQGIAYPIADKLINKIVLRYQDDFRRTLSSFERYRNLMKTDVLDDATKLTDSNVLKGKLLDAKTDISRSFQSDVLDGIETRFKNTQIYGDLVTDLKGVKTWAKAAKWADVFAGPLFDAATVAVSAWQLAEAIKNNDPYAIASSSLGLASGLAGITGFAVAALATAGSTLAAVAGPVGAIIGAILGITAIIVEIIASLNPYIQIDKDIKMLNQLRDASKKYLDADAQNLQKLVPTQANVSFSWVYELNQGHLIDIVTGRAEEHQQPVVFRLDKTGKTEGSYLIVGEKKQFDKSKYPKNLFWNPQGIIDLGYDFYGKKVTPEFQGATVIGSTELVNGKGAELRGMDIKTFVDPNDNHPDSVVIGDMYDLALWNNIEVKTGGGNDVIVINGLIGKPGHKDYPGHAKYNWGYANKIDIKTTAGGSEAEKKRESNILSFEGMSTKDTHDYGITGVHYRMRGGSLYYLSNKEGSPKEYLFGTIEGIKMFIGTPFNDIVTISMDHDFVVRQTKGSNQYVLETTSWDQFSITIDDQCEQPGNLRIEEGHTSSGIVRTTDLVYSKGTRTMFIYGRQTNQRWQLRGKIFFNRRREGYPMIRTVVKKYGTAEDVTTRLDELPEVFEAQGRSDFINKDVDYEYHFDRSIEGRCGHFKILLNPPDFQKGAYNIDFRARKNSPNELILKEEFVNKCLKKAQRSLHLIRSWLSKWHDKWTLKLFAPNGIDNNDCPGKNHEVYIPWQKFDWVVERMGGGKSRLLVDFRTEHRDFIDIRQEMKKMDDMKKFQFSEDIQGEMGVPQAAQLGIPKDRNPSDTVRTVINLKGGQRLNEDSLVFTEELRKWLKDNNRKIKLVKGTGGNWKINIEDSDGEITHEVTLKNIEYIVYDKSDGSLRVLVVPNLATATEDSLDLEQETAQKERRATAMEYSYPFNDCKAKEFPERYRQDYGK